MPVRTLPVLLAGLLLAASANAEVLGYITGTRYRQLPSETQKIWFMGVLDGIMAESLHLPTELKWLGVLQDPETAPGYTTWLGRCIESHDIDQLEAIFRKALAAEPESWHAPAAFVARSAISDFCKPPHVKKPSTTQ